MLVVNKPGARPPHFPDLTTENMDAVEVAVIGDDARRAIYTSGVSDNESNADESVSKTAPYGKTRTSSLQKRLLRSNPIRGSKDANNIPEIQSTEKPNVGSEQAVLRQSQRAREDNDRKETCRQ